MAIGRTFPESLQKALRSMETGLTGLDDITFAGLGQGDDKNVIRAALGTPSPDRLLKVAQALRLGFDEAQIFEACKIDPWFIRQIKDIVDMEARVREHGLPATAAQFRMLKGMGFSDERLGKLAGLEASEVRPGAGRSTCIPSTSASTLARPSSPRPRPICIRPMRRRSRASRPARRGPRKPRRSSFSAAGRTASARASSSTIAAAMRRSRCRTRATRPSWSIAIRRRSRPTTTPPTGSISSR